MDTKLQLLLLTLLSVPLMVPCLPEVSVGCKAPYSAVGGKCISVNTPTKGTWHEMKNYCYKNGGRMVTIGSADFFYYLVKFIKDNGLPGHNYWVGANNENKDKVFYWLDGTVVKMGTPFWATDGNVQQPNGHEDCVALQGGDFFFMHDYPCTTFSFPTFCESTSQTPRILHEYFRTYTITDKDLIKTPSKSW